MGQAVLISIRPKWCELIANGKKTVEVRKNSPKLKTPFKCYIYCTKPSKRHQTICGCMVLNSDELFRHPRKGIKYGDSIELMCEDDYSADNFLNGKVIGEFMCRTIEEFDSAWSEYAYAVAPPGSVMPMQTLIHEWVHGVLVLNGHNKETEDELLVNSLALAIFGTFKLKEE